MASTWAAVAAGTGWALTPRSLAGAVPQNTRCVRLADFLIPFGVDMVHAAQDRMALTHAFLEVARGVRDNFVKQERVGAPMLQPAAQVSPVSKRRRH
jgi:DNA-binding transcriptional LysR family regulator